MSMRRIIPCLDVSDGRVVKGIRFSGLRDAGDPVEQAMRYEAEGADELCILDICATDRARAHSLDVIERVRAVLAIPLVAGGGVRSLADATRLLEAGADKVAINSAALANPALVSDIADALGAQCCVVAIDAARQPGGWQVLVRGGRAATGVDAVSWAREAAKLGAGELLLTSWDRDGTGGGYDLDLLRAVTAEVSIPVIASGGAAKPLHMVEAIAAGADAVLAASIFHDRKWSVGRVKHELAGRDVPVRRAALGTGMELEIP